MRHDLDDLAGLVARLRAAGCVFAEQEAALLREAATGAADLARLVARREAGEPLEHLLGQVDFCGLRLAVGPGVFVPRQRTALLVQEAAARLAPGDVVVELCCGVAAVSAALAARVPDLVVHAADVDPAAAALAARNLPVGAVHVGDLDAPLPPVLQGRVDLLVANAPYVPTDALALLPPEARLHEPRVALDGGPDGLDVQRRVAACALRWLRPGGHLVVETSEGQAQQSCALLAAAGLVAHVVQDDDLGATAVVGRVVERA